MKNCTGMQSWILTCYVLAILVEVVIPEQIRQPAGVLQVIRRLGENRSGGVKVSQGRSKGGESPIYYIKLPPTPYFYMPNVVSSPGAQHEKVPVDFTNNGRPNQVYHWNLPEVNTQFFRPPSPPAGLPAEFPALYPVAPLAELTAILPATIPFGSPAGLNLMPNSVPVQDTAEALPSPTAALSEAQSPGLGSREPQPFQDNGLTEMSQKKWQTLKKQYTYNGRPSGVYIFKSKKPVYLEKYRRPLGKLLKF